MSSAIIPEVVGQTEILEESPMTKQEQKELVETETVIKASFQGKMERDLAIGAGLLKIKRQKKIIKYIIDEKRKEKEQQGNARKFRKKRSYSTRKKHKRKSKKKKHKRKPKRKSKRKMKKK